MLRSAFYCYSLLSIALVATSIYTGRRATRISGRPHYMLTTTRVLVDEEVPPENAADAAFDAALREAGASTKLPVEKPLFVLGFADATGPIVLGGGLLLLVLKAVSLLRRRRSKAGESPASELS
jgi:hypothetical protein